MRWPNRQPVGNLADMQAVAIAEQPATPTTRAAPKPRPIPRKIAKACRLIITGECTTKKAAAERAGLTAEYFYTMLGDPRVEAFIAQESRKTIAAGQMRASARLVELLDAQSEHVSLDAAKHTLGIAGIRPTEDAKIVNNISLAGYMVDLTAVQVVEEHTPTTVDVQATEPSEDR